jgi:hypothetical protein
MLRLKNSPIRYRIRHRVTPELYTEISKQLFIEIDDFASQYKAESQTTFSTTSTWHQTFCDGFLTLDATEKCPLGFQEYLSIAFHTAVRKAKNNLKHVS